MSADYDIEQVVNAVWKLEDQGVRPTLAAVRRRLRRWTPSRIHAAIWDAYMQGSVAVADDGTWYLA